MIKHKKFTSFMQPTASSVAQNIILHLKSIWC